MSDRDISELTRLVGIAVQGINELRERFSGLEQKVDGVQAESAEFRQEVNQRFDDLRQEMNGRFDALRQEINQRFDNADERLENVEEQTKLMQSDIYDARARNERTNQRVRRIEEELRDKAA